MFFLLTDSKVGIGGPMAASLSRSPDRAASRRLLLDQSSPWGLRTVLTCFDMTAAFGLGWGCTAAFHAALASLLGFGLESTVAIARPPLVGARR